MIKWRDVVKFVNHGNPEPPRKVYKTDEDWKKVLSPVQYKITRKKGTEPPFSYLKNELKSGVYKCVCCGEPLFDKYAEFDSGSGWPSYTQPVAGNKIKYEKDTSHGMVRVEISCNVCGSHLGHVFPDGPEPSGLRFCVNSVSLRFEPLTNIQK